jgi:AbrB family looped-hinge helix DNA binding protein
MAKVTSKLQITIPKKLAERYGIEPGDDIEWVPAGDAIRIVPARREDPGEVTVERRLELFDRATERQRKRQEESPRAPATDRGWTREELYQRGRPR